MLTKTSKSFLIIFSLFANMYPPSTIDVVIFLQLVLLAVLLPWPTDAIITMLLLSIIVKILQYMLFVKFVQCDVASLAQLNIVIFQFVDYPAIMANSNHKQQSLSFELL